MVVAKNAHDSGMRDLERCIDHVITGAMLAQAIDVTCSGVDDKGIVTPDFVETMLAEICTVHHDVAPASMYT